MPKFLLNLFLVISHYFKYPLKRFWLVVSYAASSNFHTIQNHVVLSCQYVCDVLLFHQPFHVTWLWRRERIVGKCPVVIIILFKEGKVNNPHKIKMILVQKLQPSCQFNP